MSTSESISPAAASRTTGERRPAAVLWDMDGTLIDSEPYWIAEEHALVAEHGGVWSDEHAHQLVGNELLVSAEYIRTHGPVDLEPEEIVHRLLTGVVRRVQEQMPWRPGARELLTELVADGVPCALVTMSWRSLADAVVATLPDGTFTAVVTGDEVTKGKPDPEPYLRAAELLGVATEDCVAIEDSPAGAASAVAAGTRTIAVPHVVPVPPAAGQTILQTLDGVRADELMALTDQARPSEAAARRATE